MYGILQSGVCGDASSDGDLFDAGLFGRFFKFGEQNVDNCFLQGGAQVVEVVADEIRIFFDFVADKVEKGGFQSTKLMAVSFPNWPPGPISKTSYR